MAKPEIIFFGNTAKEQKRFLSLQKKARSVDFNLYWHFRGRYPLLGTYKGKQVALEVNSLDDAETILTKIKNGTWKRG